MNNYYKYLLVSIICLTIVLVSISFNSCDDSPTEPENKPGRRDYVWEVDTLNIPFTILQGIWGSAPDDVWAIGPGGALDQTIYHFDGVSWKNDGKSRKISPLSIWGFAKNDVWLGGYEGRIWHYDGSEWSESLHIDHSDYIYSGFENIWGENKNNIWAVGVIITASYREGLVYHFDGKAWSKVNIEFKHGDFLKIKRGLKTSNNYYLWGIKEDNLHGDTTILFEYSGGDNLIEISKSPYGNGKWQFVQEIDDEIIFTINNKLFTYENNKLELFATNNFQHSYQAIFGRNRKDIFWVMEDGITHFNGINIEYILDVDSTHRLTDGILFQDNVFFLAVDFYNDLNLVYHGKIK